MMKKTPRTVANIDLMHAVGGFDTGDKACPAIADTGDKACRTSAAVVATIICREAQ